MSKLQSTAPRCLQWVRIGSLPWQCKYEKGIPRIRPLNFRGQFRCDKRGPTTATDACGHRDVLLPFRDVRDRKSLSRSRQPRLPKDFSCAGIVSVHVAIPITAEDHAAGRCERGGVCRRWSTLAPQHLSGTDIQCQEFTKIATGFRMLVIRARDRTGAASADDLFDRAKCRFLSMQAKRNVERVRLSSKGHRAPALEPGSAWAHVDLDADLRNLAGKVCDLPVLRIDLHDRLITEIGRVDELAIGPIELPENAQLAHLEKRLASSHIDQNVLEYFIHVLRFAGQVLVVPLDLSRVRVKRKCRVGIKSITVGASRNSGPWLRLRSAPIDEIGFGIVAAGNP